MVSELEKYVYSNQKYKKFMKKSGGFAGPFVRAVFYYFF